MQKLKYGLFFLFFAASQFVAAQGHLSSSVRFNKSKVYVGEPIEVSITAFTSTWFTKGVDPGNVKVDGAFTIYFRGVSITKRVNGQNYAGVQMIFNVFPYEAGTLTFPSLDINVETPDKGGYKGVRRNIKTNAKTIEVQPIPKGYNKNEWLVATNVKVDESWTGDVNRVKVGDVLERSITRTAAGTVSGLIPVITWDTISNVSIYPEVSAAENIRSKTSISAARTDGVNYLFEKEGEITLPEMEIKWWNASEKRLYKRTLKAITINVLPNPDLELLQTIRDSLAVLSTGNLGSEGENTGIFQKLTKKQIAVLILLLIGFVYTLAKFLKWYRSTKGVVAYLKEGREKYRHSEKFYFKQFTKAAKSGNTPRIVSTLYGWLDRIEMKEPTLIYFAQNFGDERVIKEAGQLMGNTASKNSTISLSPKSWSNARKKYFKRASGSINFNKKIRINP